MGMSGLGSLVSGFQQGYTFADDAQRKQKEDAHADKVRSHQEKEMDSEDQYKSEIQSLEQQYGHAPAPSTTPTAPAPIAASGVSPDASTTQAASPSAAPTDPAAGAGASAPVAAPTSAAQVASAGLPQAPKADPFMSMNSTMDFALKRAQIDARYGKMDGAGLVGLTKMVDSFKTNKMNDAISLLNQGRYDEAEQIYNSNGDHTGVKILSAQDGQFNIGKTAVPTKIVTIQNPDGSTRTINTAQALYQIEGIGKMIESAQKERELGINEKHGNDVVAATREGNQLQHKDSMARLGVERERLGLEKDAFKKQSLQGQLDQIETITGPLSADDRKKVGMRLAGLGKDDDSLNKFVDGIITEGVKAGTVKPEDAMNARDRLLQSTKVAQDENVVATELASKQDDPNAYAASYVKALKVIPAPRLQQMGFHAPANTKARIAAANGVMGASSSPTAAAAPDKFGNRLVENGVVDVINDLVLKSIRDGMASLDPNDPANTQKIMDLGKAKNQRIEQLKENYGNMTKFVGT